MFWWTSRMDFGEAPFCSSNCYCNINCYPHGYPHISIDLTLFLLLYEMEKFNGGHLRFEWYLLSMDKWGRKRAAVVKAGGERWCQSRWANVTCAVARCNSNSTWTDTTDSSSLRMPWQHNTTSTFCCSSITSWSSIICDGNTFRNLYKSSWVLRTTLILRMVGEPYISSHFACLVLEQQNPLNSIVYNTLCFNFAKWICSQLFEDEY